MLFDKVMHSINFRQRLVLIANMELANLEENYSNAVLELENMRRLILAEIRVRRSRKTYKRNLIPVR